MLRPFLSCKEYHGAGRQLFRLKKDDPGRSAQVFYRFHAFDGDYTSHVQIESQVMKAINAEYGSVLAYLKEALSCIVGQRCPGPWHQGQPERKYLTKRIAEDVCRPEAVQIRRVSLSHADYSQLMNRAIHTIVDKEGVQNYVGAVRRTTSMNKSSLPFAIP